MDENPYKSPAEGPQTPSLWPQVALLVPVCALALWMVFVIAFCIYAYFGWI